MRSLFRKVMLPAAASAGFLVAMAMPSAEAQEVAAESRPAVMLASTRSVASVAIDESGADASGAPEVVKRSTTERSATRGERVRRIGKFTIQRRE